MTDICKTCTTYTSIGRAKYGLWFELLLLEHTAAAIAGLLPKDDVRLCKTCTLLNLDCRACWKTFFSQKKVKNRSTVGGALFSWKCMTILMSNPITDKNFLFEEFSARIPILMLDYFSSNNSNFDSLDNTIWLPTSDGFGCSTRKKLEKWVIFEKIIGLPTRGGVS